MPTRYNVYSGYIHGGRKNNLIHALRGNLRVTDEFLKQFKNALNHGHRYHRVTQSPQIKQVLNNYARTLHRYKIHHQAKKKYFK
jgi:nitroimidazol reductase NimA-like FMN-containing flavoprotein (pyridoxamine 5'-phosphate oxidase superfamily)